MTNPAGDQVPKVKSKLLMDSTFKDSTIYPWKYWDEQIKIVSTTCIHIEAKFKFEALTAFTRESQEEDESSTACYSGRWAPLSLGKEYRPGFPEFGLRER